MDKEITDKDLKTLISKKLNQLRQKSKKTIEESARDLNLDYSQYYMLLKGTRLPHLLTLININKLYGLNMDWWFNDLDEIKPRNKTTLDKKITEFELVSSFNRLDDTTKPVILKMIRNYTKDKKYR